MLSLEKYLISDWLTGTKSSLAVPFHNIVSQFPTEQSSRGLTTSTSPLYSRCSKVATNSKVITESTTTVQHGLPASQQVLWWTIEGDWLEKIHSPEVFSSKTLAHQQPQSCPFVLLILTTLDIKMILNRKGIEETWSSSELVLVWLHVASNDVHFKHVQFHKEGNYVSLPGRGCNSSLTSRPFPP